jgi:hypothetical protein
MASVLASVALMASVLASLALMASVLASLALMASVLASSAIDCGFEPRYGQTKEYNIGICCFSAKHAELRSKSKDWLARDQNNVSEWSDTFTRRLLFQ